MSASQPGNDDTKNVISSTIFGRLSAFAQLGMGLTGALVLWLTFSAALHIGGTLYLTVFVPPDQRVAIGEGLTDRFVSLLLEEQEEEPPLLEEPEEEEIAELETAWERPGPEPEPEPEAEPEPEPEPEPESEPEPEPPIEIAENPGPPGGGDGMGDIAIRASEGGAGPTMELGNGRGRRAETTSDRRDERRAERREARERNEESRGRVARIEDPSVDPCEHMRRDPDVPYPRELREQAISGTVRLQCIVTAGGHVRACRHRGGPDELYDVAEPVVTQWRCSPAENADGERIAAPFTFRIPFNLEA